MNFSAPTASESCDNYHTGQFTNVPANVGQLEISSLPLFDYEESMGTLIRIVTRLKCTNLSYEPVLVAGRWAIQYDTERLHRSAEDSLHRSH